MVLSIYLDPCTVNSRKVLAGLDLIGIQYDYNFINYFTGEHKAEDFVKNVNPHATVPAAKDGDLRLTESNSILMYAADVAKNDATYPKDLKARADANRWLLWEASVWFQTNYVYLVEYVVKPLLGAQPDQAIIDKEAPNWHKAAKCLEERLEQTRKWILPGDSPSIVDISVASPMHLHAAQQLPLQDYPYIRNWIANVEKLPCWVSTQGAVEKALLPNKSANGDSKEVRGHFNYTKDLGDKLTELYFCSFS